MTIQPAQDIDRVHTMDWRKSVTRQLELRKSIEQTPFEEICSLATKLSDKIHTLTRENNRLNSELLNLENLNKIFLAEGTDAAREVYSRLSMGKGDTSGGSNKSMLSVAEKAQLEKKISDLQEILASTLKEKSDESQKLVDVRARLDEKESVNKSLSDKLENTLKENEELKKFRDHLRDENTVLNLEYQTLKKKILEAEKLIDNLRRQILDFKNEKANFINAQNERESRERITKESGAEMNKILVDRFASTSRRTDTFENLIGHEELGLLSAPSSIPKEIELSISAHEAETTAVHWYCCSGPMDNFIATGSSCDRKVKIWKLSNGAGTMKISLHGCNASITSIDTEADAILASSNDYAIRLWSLNHYRLVTCLTGHADKVSAAKFLGFPTKVASGSIDRTVKMWDVERGACIKTLFPGSSCLALVHYDGLIITGHHDGKIRAWDTRQSSQVSKPAEIRQGAKNEPTCQVVLPTSITSLDASRQGQLICTLKDNTIRSIDMRTLEVQQTYSDEKFKLGSEFYRVKFSPDGKLLGCGSSEGALYIWNAETAKVEAKLAGSPTRTCCWSPDGQRIASIGKGKKVTVWT